MKRKKHLFLCFALTLMLALTSCDDPADESRDSSSQIESGDEAQSGESGDTASGEASTGEATSEAAPEQSILDGRQALDDTGILWYIPNTRVEQSLQQELLPFQGGLLLWGSGMNADGTSALTLTVLSLETGEVLKETALVGIELADVQLCGDQIAVTDMSDGDVRILNEDLQITKEYQADAEYCTVHVNPDATKVFVFTQNAGIQITDMATGTTKVLLENTQHLFANNRCGDAVTISYTDPTTQLSNRKVIDLKTGALMDLPFTGVFDSVAYSDEVWLAHVLGEENTYYLGQSERPSAFTPAGTYSMVTLLAEPTRLLFTNYDETGTAIMAIYDAAGSFLSECRLSIEGPGLTYDPVWSEADGGYFFTVTDASGKDILLFWDFATPITGEDLVLETAYAETAQPGTAVSQTLYDRAARLSDNYGIEVKIAEQIAPQVNEFTFAQELDEAYISAALDTLETVLASYPAGFLAQLKFGTQQTLEFHLTGALTQTDLDPDATGFTSFVGLASMQEGKTVALFNITNPGLAQTIYHEIAHLIDYKLEFDANLRDGALYSEEAWNALNPESFTYAETKTDLPMSFYTDGYEDWFIDLYSRTFANEDQATIMEHAMIGEDWRFSAAPGRLAKLDYWCRCIRDTFDTTGWPDETVWEATRNNSK